MFVVAFALFILVGEIWSLATPLNGGPDERAHTIKAAAVVRGQWLGHPVPGAPGAYTSVRVPRIYTDFGIDDCVRGRPAEPEGTCPRRSVPDEVVQNRTYVGHYPPLYYLLVGWPTVLATQASIYLMRAMSVLASSLFLALAVATACCWSRSKVLLPAVAVAITPMALFLSGVINPSGLEISAAVAMWTAAVVLVTDQAADPPAALIGVLTAATCVELLVRGDSPLWPAVCLLVMLPLAWRRLPLRTLYRRVSVRVAGFCLGLAAAGTVAWYVVGQPQTIVPQGGAPPGATGSEVTRMIVGSTGSVVQQMVGNFGWLDTPAPFVTYLIWFGVAGALLLLAVLIGRARHLASLAVAIVASVLVTFVVLESTIRQENLAQGRYFLPLAVSIPIVAGALGVQAGLPRRASARWSSSALVLLCAGQVAAGWWALRRYLVGDRGPLLPTATVPGVWHPPLPGWTLDLAFLLAWTAFAFVGLAEIRRSTLGRPFDRANPVTAGTEEPMSPPVATLSD